MEMFLSLIELLIIDHQKELCLRIANHYLWYNLEILDAYFLVISYISKKSTKQTTSFYFKLIEH